MYIHIYIYIYIYIYIQTCFLEIYWYNNNNKNNNNNINNNNNNNSNYNMFSSTIIIHQSYIPRTRTSHIHPTNISLVVLILSYNQTSGSIRITTGSFQDPLLFINKHFILNQSRIYNHYEIKMILVSIPS